MPPRPFAPPGTRTNFVGDRPVRLDHVRLEWEIDLAAKRLSGTATLTVAARREGLTSVSFDAVELDVESVTVGKHAGRLHQRRPVAARDAGRAAGRERTVRGRRPLRLPAAPRALLRRPRRQPPRSRAAVLDPGAGRRRALLLALPRSADRKVHHRGDLHGARRSVRAVERRSARADRALSSTPARHPLALRAHAPAAGLSAHAGGRPLRRAARPRREDRRRRLRLLRAGARGRRAPQLRPHRRDDRPLLREDRPALPARALQPDHRPRVHLRRDGEHQRHHADRSDAARRAGRARPRRRRPRLARAGAPVVGRSARPAASGPRPG